MILSDEPQVLSEHKHYYEEKKGIWITQWVDFGNGRKVVETLIPWKMLEKSMARYKKLKRFQAKKPKPQPKSRKR